MREGLVLAVVADFISPLFYDLFHEDGHVPKIRKNLPPLLSGVERSILEVGAGTGLITTSLASWTPAEIFALEPSAEMRGILLSRLGSRPEGDRLISEEEIVGYGYKPTRDTLQRELEAAGFTQAKGTEGLLAWQLT